MQSATNFCFDFDFDEWARLAKANPRAFEARRRALINDYLRQFSDAEQRRLRGLQFRIDMERLRARSPMAACVRLSSMMWDSFMGPYGLKKALEHFLTFQPDAPNAQTVFRRPPTEGKVIPFRKPSR